MQLRREVAQNVVQPAAPKGPSNKFYVDFVARLSALSLLRPSLDNVRCSTVGTAVGSCFRTANLTTPPAALAATLICVGRSVRCAAAQCSAAQRSAVQCSAVQCSAVQCSAVQCHQSQSIAPAVRRNGRYDTAACATKNQACKHAHAPTCINHMCACTRRHRRSCSRTKVSSSAVIVGALCD